jgi:hypothetical protein
MGVPTNYNKQEPQIQKRFDSLNDLRYYTVKYDIKINKDYLKLCEENMAPIEFAIIGESEYGEQCIKRFSAMTDEIAERNIILWLESMKDENKVTDYVIEDISGTDLTGILDEKQLLPLFNEDLFNEVLENSKDV